MVGATESVSVSVCTSGLAYVTKEADEMIRKLEHDTEYQIATASSAVKGVAAERDLLSSAEGARNFLLQLVTRDKDTLEKVFGGGSGRLGRLRALFDRVTFSEMHARDRRWQNLQSMVDTVEAILREMDTCRPWTPATARGSRQGLWPGRCVSMKLDDDVTAFDVEPELPPTLKLSHANREITLALQPGAALEEETYVVTARNSAGEKRATLVILVKEDAQDPPVIWEVTDAPSEKNKEPPAVSSVASPCRRGHRKTLPLPLPARPSDLCAPVYPKGLVYKVGEPVEIVPEATPGVAFSVRPPLPDGLTIDASTGVISGTPREPISMASYEIRVEDAGAEAVTIVNVEIQPVPPSLLSYPQASGTFRTGQVVELVPEFVGMPSLWSVAPGLPAGLKLDPTTGIISGTLSSALKQATWTVTASNVAGASTCKLALDVEATPPPSGLAYPELHRELALYRAVVFKPAVEGGASRFCVSPELPAGLHLDAQTGLISGVPQAVAEERAYQVTAWNSSGAAIAKVTFAVRGETQQQSHNVQDVLHLIGGMRRDQAGRPQPPASAMTPPAPGFQKSPGTPAPPGVLGVQMLQSSPPAQCRQLPPAGLRATLPLGCRAAPGEHLPPQYSRPSLPTGAQSPQFVSNPALPSGHPHHHSAGFSSRLASTPQLPAGSAAPPQVAQTLRFPGKPLAQSPPHVHRRVAEQGAAVAGPAPLPPLCRGSAAGMQSPVKPAAQSPVAQRGHWVERQVVEVRKERRWVSEPAEDMVVATGDTQWV